MMRNRFHFISLAAVMFFGLESVAAADTFRIRLTGARCADDPACHNRFHPAIKPVITVKPGDTVIMETRDAFDGQITRTSTAADVIPTFLGGPLNLNLVHPLTGPVAIQGAEPSDLLVVHIVDIIQDDFAYTINVPGFGFLRSEVPGPAILHWDIKGDVATSRDLPGVRIHAEPSMGTTGIALSVVKFTLRKGEAKRLGVTTFQFERDNFFAPPERAVPERFFATTGISVDRVTGKNESEDLTLSARNAALNMIDHLVRTRGLTRQQAYMLSSTAVDLHINQLVDVPNFLVSAFLHLDVFQDDVGDEEGK